VSLKDKISDDLKQALKEGDDVRKRTLRLLLAAVHNAEIEKGGAGVDAAVERLQSAGIFAIAQVREARKKAKDGTPAAGALDRVIRLYKIKEITPDPLQELADFYRLLSGGTVEEKRALLVDMFTRHPAESRMGKGKGTPEGWVAVVKPGTVMFEMAGVKPEFAKEALNRAAQKLPIRARFMQTER
jgi:hypothetical protein